MTTTNTPVNLQEVLTSYASAIRLFNAHPIRHVTSRARTRTAITRALTTIPALCQETTHLRALLHIATLDHASLVAAARATITAGWCLRIRGTGSRGSAVRLMPRLWR